MSLGGGGGVSISVSFPQPLPNVATAALNRCYSQTTPLRSDNFRTPVLSLTRYSCRVERAVTPTIRRRRPHLSAHGDRIEAINQARRTSVGREVAQFSKRIAPPTPPIPAIQIKDTRKHTGDFFYKTSYTSQSLNLLHFTARSESNKATSLSMANLPMCTSLSMPKCYLVIKHFILGRM